MKLATASRDAAGSADLAEAVRLARYAFREDATGGAGWVANPAQRILAKFDGGVTSIRSAKSTGAPALTLRLESWGRASAPRMPLPPAKSEISRAEARHLHDGITEWWRNDTRGLEQGFTIADRPEGNGAIVLQLDAGRELTARAEGTGIVFSSARGDEFSYDHLVTVDANERVLPSTMSVVDGDIHLKVDDTAAVYPIVIDPLVASFEAKLEPGTGGGETVALFGWDVALDGDTAVVGAPEDDTQVGANAGAAYVFVRSEGVWTEQQRIEPPDAAESDRFGMSVALEGDTLVVGAESDDFSNLSDPGSAYIYVRAGSSWIELTRLYSPAPASFDGFGVSADISGDRVIIGASQDDTAEGADSGSAFVYLRSGSTWLLEDELTTTDLVADERFGFDVAIDGDTAVIGARDDLSIGAAYVFVRSGSDWSKQAELVADDTTGLELFGSSVAIDGDTALIGAPNANTTAGTDAGCAFVFVRSGTVWTQQARLEAADASPSAMFGYSVSLDLDTAAIGAPRSDAGDSPGGQVYIFQRTTTVWSEETNLSGDGTATNSYVGSSVALDGGTLIAGAYAVVSQGRGGAAFIFVETGGTWELQQEVDAGDGSSGSSAGTAVAIDGDTALVAAPEDDNVEGSAAGSVYVFVRTNGTWTEQARLFTTHGDLKFGESVALDGDTAVIGAPVHDVGPLSGAGDVHVFVRSGTTWSEQAILVAPVPGAHAILGYSVDIDGDTVIAGAPRAAGNAGVTGNAQVFVRSGTVWAHQATLTSANLAADDEFGCAVAVDGDRALVGAREDQTTAGASAGSAYVFERTNSVWAETEHLEAGDGAPSARFGYSVDLDGSTAIIGSKADAAYVFAETAGNWSAPQKLTDGTGYEFGYDVAVEGDVAVVGLPSDDRVHGEMSGAVDIFQRVEGTWVFRDREYAPDGDLWDYLGASVAISGTTVIAGAPYDSRPAGQSAGSAYVFQLKTGFEFYVVSPCRVKDSRSESALVSGVPATVTLAGVCGIPADARAVVLNVTAVDPSADGHLTLYAGDATLPPTSTINFRAGRTRANNAVIPLASNGDGTLKVRAVIVGGGNTHYIIDVSGYLK